jgi:aryl-alcohol dehydrogenase-like predicted oxidoreductase
MVELEVIPSCKEFGLGLIPYSPIAGGLLAGSLSKAKEGRRASESIQKGIQKYEKQLEAYETFCRNYDAHPANVALAWLVHNPIVTSPIIGPRTIEQLESSIKALEIVLSDEDMVRLDKLWPGPGGQAPEAYAW